MSEQIIFVVVIIALVMLMIFFNALYVGAEFATVGSRKTRIRQMAGQGNRQAQSLLPILEDAKKLDDYVATCQLGITISSLVLAAFGQRYIAPFLPDSLGAGTASIIILAVLTLLQVVFGELVPKSFAVQYPETLALWVIQPIRWSSFIMRPLIWFFNGSGKLLLRLIGKDAKDHHANIHSPEEIEMLVGESHEGGLLDDQERRLLRNAFRLSDLNVRQVMVHRTKIISVSAESSAAELIDAGMDAGYTRIPVYQETIDSIVGFVHIKDAFRLQVKGEKDISSAIRSVIHVPEAMTAVDVWNKLNKSRQYMAVVFDEYGGTAGILTLEDLIEEIFGELQDEFDDEKALVRLDKQGRVHLRGDLLISDVNEYFEMGLPDDSADTIGGLVFTELGRRPKVGDEVEVKGIPIRVEALDDVRIARVSTVVNSPIDLSQLIEWEVEHD